MSRILIENVSALLDDGDLALVAGAHIALDGRRIAAVGAAPDGFTPDEVPNEFLSRLKGNNLNIINCSRGNLEVAIKELGNYLFSVSKVSASVG